MARITSEKAAEMIGNKFDLILVAAQRARELKNGSAPKLKTNNGDLVTALREIEQGLYTKADYLKSRKGLK
jgi:DNA-directed RNA polymerase subunit omega